MRALSELERDATRELPVGRGWPARADSGRSPTSELASELVNSLDPSFRSQELSFAVSQIAANIDLAAAAERRSWLERLLGRQPHGSRARPRGAGARGRRMSIGTR